METQHRDVSERGQEEAASGGPPEMPLLPADGEREVLYEHAEEDGPQKEG